MLKLFKELKQCTDPVKSRNGVISVANGFTSLTGLYFQYSAKTGTEEKIDDAFPSWRKIALKSGEISVKLSMRMSMYKYLHSLDAAADKRWIC